VHQSFGDFEFLIVDDGSDRRSSAIIDDWAARDSRIRVIRQENRGFVASLNRLLGEARAPLVARMDGDDICLPDRFAKQLAFLADHPDHGVIGTWSACIQADGSPHPLQPAPKPLSHQELVANFGKGPLLNHNAVIYRRDLVRSVGGYRPAFRHCEDLDLWLRLAHHTRMANLPENLILYRRFPEQVSHRYMVEQALNAQVALAAHEERLAGRPDPTEGLRPCRRSRLSTRCSAAKGSRGASARAPFAVYLYDPRALAEEGYPIILDHVRDGAGANRSALWRAAIRLARHGRVQQGIGLALTLAFAFAMTRR
jgi:hypothetical protein